MDLYRIQNDLIADRAPEAWFNPKIAGPFFHYRWTFGTGAGGGFSHVIGEHHSHATLREDPSLTMGWGLDVDSLDDRRDRHFEWAEKFVNTNVRPFWVDFFWNNALVDRVELASVDGGHGIIPMPSWGKTVTHYEMAVAHLIYGLDGARDASPAGYVDELGFTVVPDDNRHGAGSPRSHTD
ncbi:hypothetical protein [Nocardioides zeicaulis]|uniref:Uncharacterized protein n=1 Tax=Nocardioides zeicaulis TaxID=1776857 RepID=A0ABV6E1I9_9ACTN